MSESRFGNSWGSDDSADRAPFVQRLLDAPNLPAFITDLITTQATTVAGTEAAGFLIERGPEGFTFRLLGHIRPDQSTKEIREAAIKAFMDLIKPCVSEGKDGAIELANPGEVYQPESQYCLVTLLRADGQAVAVSAVITRCMNLDRAKQRLQSMQLVAGYFELFTLRHNAEQAGSIALSDQHVLNLLANVANADGFDSAAAELCNELADRSGAARVSLGWVKKTRIQIESLSHTETFDQNQELVVALQRAMQECADQKQCVRHGPEGDSSQNITRAAAAFSRSQGNNIVLSLPLRNRAEICGVITLEFLQTRVDPQLFDRLAVAVQLLGPQLYNHYDRDRASSGAGALDALSRLIGPGHRLGKLVALLLIAALVYVFFYRPR